MIVDEWWTGSGFQVAKRCHLQEFVYTNRGKMDCMGGFQATKIFSMFCLFLDLLYVCLFSV